MTFTFAFNGKHKEREGKFMPLYILILIIITPIIIPIGVIANLVKRYMR